MKKRFLTIMAIMGLAFAATSGLTACNTVEGFGQDVETAGDAIEDAGQNAYND